MKILTKLGIVIILIALFTLNVNALGITPGRNTIYFEANKEYDLMLKVINNEFKDMKVSLSVAGEISKFVKLERDLIEFNSTEEERTIKFKVKLPNDLGKPGIHEAEIIATELSKETKGELSIGATISVGSQLRIRVPYPGKYAEIELDISEANSNETITFVIPVFNYGTEKIKKAEGVVEIYNKDQKIASVKTDNKEIDVNNRRELVARWVANINSGEYIAKAIIDYDGKKAEKEKVFNIGNLMIDIKNIFVKFFNLGEIAKFNILVESKWNKKLTNIWMEFKIKNDKGDIISEFKTHSIDLEPYGTGNLIGYWDTKGVNVGVYSATIIMHYEGKTAERQITLEVNPNSINVHLAGLTGEVVMAKERELKTSSIIMILVVILTILNIAWYIHMKKRKGIKV